MAQPFARARAMFALVAAAMGDMVKLAAIGQYKSRGHGRGTPSRRYGNKAGKYMPHQGKRECARRLGQLCAHGSPDWFKAAGDAHRPDLTDSPLWPLRNEMHTAAWRAFTGDPV